MSARNQGLIYHDLSCMIEFLQKILRLHCDSSLSKPLAYPDIHPIVTQNPMVEKVKVSHASTMLQSSQQNSSKLFAYLHTHPIKLKTSLFGPFTAFCKSSYSIEPDPCLHTESCTFNPKDQISPYTSHNGFLPASQFTKNCIGSAINASNNVPFQFLGQGSWPISRLSPPTKWL